MKTLAANSKMVDMVVLSGSYILVNKRSVYFTIWRHIPRDDSIWRNHDSGCLLERLLWVSPGPISSCGSCSHCLSTASCCYLRILHRTVELPEAINFLPGPLPFSEGFLLTSNKSFFSEISISHVIVCNGFISQVSEPLYGQQ